MILILSPHHKNKLRVHVSQNLGGNQGYIHYSCTQDFKHASFVLNHLSCHNLKAMILKWGEIIAPNSKAGSANSGSASGSTHGLLELCVKGLALHGFGG